MNNIINNFPLEYDAVILAAGDFPHHLLPIKILKQAKNLFVCDGALQNLLDLEIIPTAIIGDGDSLNDTLKQQFKDIYHQVNEQEENDLTKATRYAIAHIDKQINNSKRPRFCYIGATGKREDHTLGNISLMVHYYESLGIVPTMVTDYGWFTVGNGRKTFVSMPRQQVSIFNFGCESLTSEALRYPLYPVKEWWQGTLNEALADYFTIEGNGRYLVYQTFDVKE